MVSDLVLKKLVFEKSIGFGIEKSWYRKKYRIRYRTNLVSEKSFGFGFVQILGIVTHWNEVSKAVQNGAKMGYVAVLVVGQKYCLLVLIISTVYCATQCNYNAHVHDARSKL